MSAYGGKADLFGRHEKSLLMTQNGHSERIYPPYPIKHKTGAPPLELRKNQGIAYIIVGNSP